MELSASQQEWIERVRKGDTRAAARLMRAIDDRWEGYLGLLSALHPHTGQAYLVGITGTPGAGKSTLVDRLIRHYRAAGSRVGVLAVDPSSPFSGGAILGDRIRMQQHFLDEGVFIRSLATRGHLGGLSRSAGDVLRVLDAYGCDVILVETVGVGQDELEVARLAHTTVVVTSPGGGDDVQAIKAGILEIADVFVVNKADRQGADSTVRELEGMLALTDTLARAGSGHRGHSAAALRQGKGPREANPEHWTPPVLKTVASKDEGTQALVEACAEHARFLRETESGRAQAEERRRDEFLRIFRDQLWSEVEERLGALLDGASQGVAQGRLDPYKEAEALVSMVLLGARSVTEGRAQETGAEGSDNE